MDTLDRSPVTPRQRVLETAAGLFYVHGIKAIGVQRVVDEAHVTLATFYRHFPSKEDLVVACIRLADDGVRDAYASGDAVTGDPAARLMQLTSLYVDEVRRPNFRGCGFINAGVEFPDEASPVRAAIAEHRRWLRETVTQIFVDAGVEEPGERGRMWIVLRDGAMVAGYLGEADDAATGFAHAARALLQKRPDAARPVRPAGGHDVH